MEGIKEWEREFLIYDTGNEKQMKLLGNFILNIIVPTCVCVAVPTYPVVGGCECLGFACWHGVKQSRIEKYSIEIYHPIFCMQKQWMMPFAQFYCRNILYWKKLKFCNQPVSYEIFSFS